MSSRFFCTTESIPPLSAVLDQEYAPRNRGMDAGQKFCRTFAVSRKPGRGGGGDWNLAAPEQILPTCHGVHAGNAEENFSGHLFSPKSMANMLTNKNVRAPAARQKFCRNTRVIRHGTSPRSSRRSYGDMKRSDRLMLLWQTWGGLLGPFPTVGNGPRRTRRLRGTLSTEHDPVVFQHRAGKPAEILPPDDSGSRRVKPSSDGWGGEVKTLS